jgi:hypothetical protein
LAKPGEQFYTDAGRSTSASFQDQVTISKVTPRETAPFVVERHTGITDQFHGIDRLVTAPLRL